MARASFLPDQVRVVIRTPPAPRLVPRQVWPPVTVMIVDDARNLVLTHARLKAEPGERCAEDWLRVRGYRPVLGSEGVWSKAGQPLLERLAPWGIGGLAVLAIVASFFIGWGWGP